MLDVARALLANVAPRRRQDHAVEQETLTQIFRVRVIRRGMCRITALAEEQLVNRRDLVARTLLRVVAVVVLPGRASLHQLAVDVDLDRVIGGAVLEVDRELDQMRARSTERRDVARPEGCLGADRTLI